MIERGNPLSGATQGPRQVEEKRPIPRRSKHVLFMKNLLNMIERGHPLSAVTQITSQEPPKHVHLMTARASTSKIKQHMIEQGNRPWRKSRARSRAINAERGEHWLPNTWIATFCCKTSSELSCSRIGQEDRESPSPTCSSTRSPTKRSLQPVQYDDKANDSGRGQRRAVWTVRDRIRNQDGKTSWPQIWENSRKERISSGP